MVGGQPFGVRRDVLRASNRKGGDTMSAIDMITLISFAVMLFITGYNLGKRK